MSSINIKPTDEAAIVGDNVSVEGFLEDIEFPKGRPSCCGYEMYAAGGVLGKRPDGKVGDIEHFWRCDICKQETVDLLS